jgi:cytochrome c oxidase subunit IV
MAQGSKTHSLRLMPFFIALSALTVGEVGLFELWRSTQFVPKIVVILIILALTLPKAAIVMIFFMHLRYEKLALIIIALAPLILVFIAILPPLTDIKTVNAGPPMSADERAMQAPTPVIEPKKDDGPSNEAGDATDKAPNESPATDKAPASP